ncbi:MAG TPA: hypothetical protein VEV87_10825, partial [Chitinophagaceae bacterium]|nr:hypothetical protein [Chitinophagaceae bacterium]
MAKKRSNYLLFLFVLPFFISCTSFFNRENKTVCKSSHKISGISPDFVYDLSGYVASGGSSPFNLFDENDFFDPKNGLTGTPTTNPQPTRQADIFFPLNKGNRIVVDLQVPYNLSEVYVYDQSRESDTIWIYTGNMRNWKLQTTIITKGEPTSWGWRRFPLVDSSQFLMIRFRMPSATINEMILYGCPTAAISPPPPTKYEGARLPKKTIGEFLGVNMYNSLPMEWLQPFSQVRMYTIANTFDMDTT